MRIGTIFSGIGAPEQAALRLGFEPVFACEWDKFARQSFKANYHLPKERFRKNVYDFDATQYRGKIEILIGGSPCQAFSIAGLRKGVNDERGELIYEYIRIVDEVKAPIIVYENVKGMLSIDKGRTIKEFVQALRDIGYHCHYDVINSKDYGVPQNRERLFLVGFLDVELYYAFGFAPKVKLTKRLRDVLESNVDEKYYLSDEMINFFKRNTEKNKEKGNGFAFNQTTGDNVAKTLTNPGLNRMDENYVKVNQLNPNYKSQCNTIHDIDKVAPTICAGTHGYAYGYIEEGVVGMLNIKGNDQIKRVYGVDGLCPTLTTMQGGGQEPKILDDQGRTRKWENPKLLDYCPTLRAQSHGNEPKVVWSEPIVQTLDCACNQAVVESYRIRKLTPRECLRLQDFPDTFKQVVSDSQLYKQAGNSMTVSVIEMIFRQIEKAKKGQCDSLFGSVV